SIAALAAITLLGAALRLLALDRVPGGLFFDVAANLFDVLDILAGARPIWFPRNNGREPLMLYLQAATALVWGPTPLAAQAGAPPARRGGGPGPGGGRGPPRRPARRLPGRDDVLAPALLATRAAHDRAAALPRAGDGPATARAPDRVAVDGRRRRGGRRPRHV